MSTASDALGGASSGRPNDEARDRLQTRTLMRLWASRAFEAGDLKAAARELTEAAAAALGVDRVAVWRFSDDDSRLLGLDAFDVAGGTHRVPPDLASAQFPVYFRALYEHRTLAAERANEDPLMREFRESYFARSGVRSTLDAPVRLGRRVLGVVCHETLHESRRWTRDDEQFAASIADLASLAIEADRLREVRADLTRKNRELDLLRRILEIALSTLDVDEGLGAMVRAIADAAPLSHVAVQVFDDASQTLRTRAAVGWSAAEEGVPLERALGGEAVYAAKPIALDPQALESARAPELAGLRTFVAAPMRLGKRVIGVLALGSTEAHEIDSTRLAGAVRIADALAVQVDRYRSIEDARLLEQRLRESQKLEALGTLAGGVAHDFNNLLTGILGHAQLLQQSAQPGTETRRAVDVIVGAAERAADLTQQLLGFARRGHRRAVPCDLHALIDDVCALCARTLPKNVVIERDFASRQPTVTGDPGQLHQALLNLALNARDAMPQGGRLVFATRDVAAASVPRRPGREHPRSAHVCVEVRDTGSGIAPENLRRVLEPFFTTKRPGKGSGLGLALVHGIVESHGGTLDVESELGRGTTFRVYLPVAGESAAPVAKSADGRTASGRVLVVDDDREVGKIAAELLRSAGYTVDVAESGAEALEQYSRAEPRFEAVLLDLEMPQMGGRECLRELRRIDPAARVVVSTGGRSSATERELLAQGAAALVHKPYDLDELAASIASSMRPDGSR